MQAGRENRDLCFRLRDDIEMKLTKNTIPARFQTIRLSPGGLFLRLDGGDSGRRRSERTRRISISVSGAAPVRRGSRSGEMDTPASSLHPSACLFYWLARCSHPTRKRLRTMRRRNRRRNRRPPRQRNPRGFRSLPRTPAKSNSRCFLAPLRDNGSPTTYAALAAFSTQNSKKDIGAHAALALAYYDLSRDKAELAIGWLRKAADDKLLREYVQYWQAQASMALGQKEVAVEQLKNFRRDYPDSVMTEQAVIALAQVAIEAGKSDVALAALENYPNTESKPLLLLLRAQSHEKVAATNGEKPSAAAADYLQLYYRFPLNDEAKAGGEKIPLMQFALGEEFPGTPMQTQLARAETFFVARRWKDARAEYANLLPKLAGADRERAVLRVAQCDVQSGGKPELLSALSLTDPELDAERVYTMSQAHRSQKLESQMLDDIDQLTKRFPQSAWAEQALFAAGNYYWVNMDRPHAVEYYRRVADGFPDGKDAPICGVARSLDRIS